MVLNFPVCVALILVVAVTEATSSSENLEFSLHRSRRETSLQKEHHCPPLTILHGHVRCVFNNNVVSCGVPMRPGTTAVPGCKPNYRADMSTHSELICLDNGRWSYQLLDCVPACGDSKEPVEVQLIIANGTTATIGLFPWHAGIYYWVKVNETMSWDQKCGGSLITDEFLLTAAHCVVDEYGTRLQKEKVRIALGKYYRSWYRNEVTEQKFNVSQIFLPSEFFRTSLTNDMALVRLDKKVVPGGVIMPVCHGLMDESSNIRGKNLFMVGWGQTREGDRKSSSEVLLYNNGNKLEPETVCRTVTPPLFSSSDKLCTSNSISDVSISNPGDSGGALTVVNDGLHYVVGIISFRLKGLKYSFATNVLLRSHHMWIEDQIRKYDIFFRWNEKQKMILNYTLGENCKQEGDILWSCVELKDCVTEAQNIYRGVFPDSCLPTGDKIIVCCKPPDRKSDEKCQEYGKSVYNKENNGRGGYANVDTCAINETGVLITCQGCDSVSPYDNLLLEHPHMAVIGSYSDHHGGISWGCIGSLISESYILSSADFYYSDGMEATQKGQTSRARGRGLGFKARLGDFNIFSMVQYNIENTIIHPNYTGYPHHFNNIALYKLYTNVKFSNIVRPICLQTRETSTSIHPKLIAVQAQTGGISELAEKVNFTLVDKDQCLNEYAIFKNRNGERTKPYDFQNLFSTSLLCARRWGKEKDDQTNWSKGSALQIRLKNPYCMYSLIGILSMGTPVGTTSTVFTRVSHFVPWIESIVWP